MYANNKILNEVAPLHEMTKEKNWRKKIRWTIFKPAEIQSRVYTAKKEKISPT